MNKDFWKDRNVFITGHTGFKGSWLCLWLNMMGAHVTGYALDPPSAPNLFSLCRLDKIIHSIKGDIRDLDFLTLSIADSQPEIVIHMAAQSLVRESYSNPIETYEINTMGTVILFEAIRHAPSVKAVINVTTDKCYENREWIWGYRETDPFGGFDPYSNSKACSELVTASFRNSFFQEKNSPAIASARAGNVIGGGDWAKDRLIVDCIRALLNEEKISIRSPNAIRPWQHVLEPLIGYLILAENLFVHGHQFAEGWNFGPDDNDAKPVQWIVEKICHKWPGSKGYIIDGRNHPHEANYLKLDCSKAKFRLGWTPKWSLEKAIDKIIDWTLEFDNGKDPREICLKQITEYLESPKI